MQFLILAHDATDAEAPARRQAVRAAHLAMIDAYKARGHMLVGAALLDEAGKPKGSTLMVDFPSQTEVNKWLAEEPYIKEKVWGEVKVIPCKLAPAFEGLVSKISSL